MPHVPQLRRQLGCAFAGPAQGRHGISSRRGIQQTVQVLQQTLIDLGLGFAPAAGLADSARVRTIPRFPPRTIRCRGWCATDLPPWPQNSPLHTQTSSHHQRRKDAKIFHPVALRGPYILHALLRSLFPCPNNTPPWLVVQVILHSLLSGFFRTTKQGDKLMGSYLTSEPNELKARLTKVPGLKVTSTEQITPEKFVEVRKVTAGIPDQSRRTRRLKGRLGGQI